jgi:hypothetical protein
VLAKAYFSLVSNRVSDIMSDPDPDWVIFIIISLFVFFILGSILQSSVSAENF